ncbi:PREDICTED: thyroid receptor-interacting protein 11-like isoform X1 [Amphimedon queenslandica]|uniref:GRIP domain-containing protein n=2 Tax=Amphimedon queenslandica TaxID=400682 RepID=A0AAN0JEQ4_AMPQE|nr:PREDICTED: thyroid receptor-interacting protein 11-like isoform X1 [Amphimedon queenslandica]|eukprot:XP_019855242.1 PREDICTED: thyroid receptor-interacting protein 11-like isoform X1 [Amphimedon queenslandica]
MSSWFSGSSFTSLTDQITSFTKDVLNETTQEIEDPVTELQVAQRQIEQLKEEASQYTTELVRLRKSNEEYRERAEAAEYQVVSNKEQYLKLLQEQEANGEKLKEQLKEMKSDQRKIVMATRSDSNLTSLEQKSGALSLGLVPPHTSTGEGLEWSGADWNEETDFEYLEVSQSKLSQLQSELARVRVECQHWKELAQDRVSENGNEGGRTGFEDHQAVTANEDVLQQERLRHEHDISALQMLHAQQLQAVNLRHRQEIENLQEIMHQETTVSQVEEEQLPVVKAELSELRLRNKQLMDKLQLNQVITGELKDAIANLKELVHLSLEGQLKNIEEEKRGLTTYITDIHTSFKSHQEIIESLQIKRTQFEEETQSLSNELERMKTKLESEGEGGSNESMLGDKERDTASLSLTGEEELLQQSEEKEGHSIQGNGILKVESEHLNQQLFELRETVKEREEAVGSLSSLLSKREEEMELLVQEREELSRQCTSLAAELSNTRLKIEEKEELLTAKDREIREKDEEIIESKRQSGDLKQAILELEEKLRGTSSASIHEEESRLSTLRQELTKQSEIITQLTQERNGLIHSRDQLLEEHNERIKENEKTHLKEILELQSKLSKCEKDLGRLREHLIEVEGHHTEEALSNKEQEEQLKEQLKLMERELGRVNEQLSQQSLEDHQLQNDLAAVVSERDHLQSSLLETQRERDQSITAMHNLQTVLEHFQKGGNELDELQGLLLKKQEELETANKECQRLLNCQQEKSSTGEDVMAASSVSDHLLLEMKQKDDTIQSLNTEIQSYQLTLKKCRAKIEQLSCDQDTNVDKQLVRNLFLSYISKQDEIKKRDKIVHVLQKVLDIDQSEIEKVLGRKAMWLPNIWPSPPSPLNSLANTPTNEQVSLSKMFVSFLESESTREIQPKSPPLLSTSLHPRPPKHLLTMQAPPTTMPETKKEEEPQSVAVATPQSLETLLEIGNSPKS